MYYNRFSKPKAGDYSKDELEFVGDEVVLYRKVKTKKGGDERVKIKRLAVSTFLKELEETSYSERLLETPLLPEGVRYFGYKRDAGDGVVVLEQAPQTRTVNWTDQKHDKSREKIIKVKLAFPFVVLICKISNDLINDIRIFYRTSLISSLNDELFHTNLRNTYPDSYKICLGFINNTGIFSGQILPQRVRGNLVDQTDQILSKLWNHCFNADIETDEFESSKYLDKKIASVEAWRKATQTDEMFPLSIRWRKTGKTVRGMINELGYGYPEQEDPLRSLEDLLDIFYRCAPGAKPIVPVIEHHEEAVGDWEMQEMHRRETDFPDGGGGWPYGR